MKRGYDEDETPEVNQARALFEIADAIRGLLYGLKYGQQDGMSIAEAIEVSGKAAAEAIQSVASAVENAQS